MSWVIARATATSEPSAWTGMSVAWTATDIPVHADGSDVAVALAITHDISAAVSNFLEGRPDLRVSTLRVYAPAAGHGHGAIAGGPEGWKLSQELAADIA